MKTLLHLLAAAAVLAPVACNAARVNAPAPELVGTSWIRPDGGDGPVALEGRYVLVEFFSPT